MPFWKCNVFFRVGTGGWSELHYLQSEDPKVVIDKMRAYISRRRGLMATNCFIEGFRISDDAVQGDSGFDFPPVEVGGGKLGGRDIESDYLFAAYLLRLEAGFLYRRSLYISGFPDWVTRPEGDQGVTINANFFAALDLFKAWYPEQGFLIKAITKGVGNPRVNIVGLGRVAVGDDHVFIDTDAPIPGVVVNNNIRIYGSGKIVGNGAFLNKSLNGTYRVTAVVGNRYTLNFTTGDIGPWNQRGTTKKSVVTFFPVTKIVPLRVTHRKRGRPFDAAAGKLKARKA